MVRNKDQYLRERAQLKEYLLVKFEAEDWHGCQDAASDLRDIDSALEVIEAYTGADGSGGLKKNAPLDYRDFKHCS